MVLGNISCVLDPKVKVKDQLMYFLINVPPPKRLDVVTSNFVLERSIDVDGTGQHFV